MTEWVLFEDARASELGPAALGRPVFDLILGARSLRSRLEACLGYPAGGAVVRARLSPLLAERGLADARCGAADVLINGAWIAEDEDRDTIEALASGEALATSEGDPLALRPADGKTPNAMVLIGGRGELETAGYAIRTVSDARLLRRAWDLIARQTELLAEDLAHETGPSPAGGDGIVLRGDRIVVEEGAHLEGPLVLDARKGPVVIRAGAAIAPFSLLEGPVLIDREAWILGGRIAASAIGRGCRVRGEVESTTILPWSNKAHEGFVGHAYVGSWVNLGAGTTTSDLKNNYGLVRMDLGAGAQSTGLRKVGSLIGDHAKTAIGTLLGAGTVIGYGSNLFGPEGATAPKMIPPFVWGAGPDAMAYDRERFLETAGVVTGRRGQSLSEEEKAVMDALHADTAPERDAWLARRQGGE